MRPEENVMWRERRLERLLVGNRARRTRYAGTGRHTPGYSVFQKPWPAPFSKKKIIHMILANSGKVSHECGKDDGTGGENALDE